jgi:uncharacterized protein (DUF983 family)
MLHQLCPRCRQGRLFRRSVFIGFPAMHESCPVCALKFEREPGYFLGAMYISYAAALITIALFAFVLWLGLRWSIEKSVVWATLLFLPLAPPITLFSRVLWMSMDRAIDPE